MKQHKMLDTLKNLLQRVREAISRLIIAVKRKFASNTTIVVPLEQSQIYSKITDVYNKAGNHPTEDDVKKMDELEKEFMENKPSSGKTVKFERSSIQNILSSEQATLKELDKKCDNINAWLQRGSGDPEQLAEVFYETRRRVSILSSLIRANTKILACAKPISKVGKAEESFISFCDELLITD
jgi:hypothetical protein